MSDGLTTSSGLTRRSIVRGGATAAWAVPVVSVAAAAPSYALTGPAQLRVVFDPPMRTGGSVTVPARIRNRNDDPAAAGYNIQVRLRRAAMGGNIGDSTFAAIPGFSGPTPSGTNGNGTVTVTFVAAAPLAGNSNIDITLNITLAPNAAAVLDDLQVIATLAAGDPGMGDTSTLQFA